MQFGQQIDDPNARIEAAAGAVCELRRLGTPENEIPARLRNIPSITDEEIAFAMLLAAATCPVFAPTAPTEPIITPTPPVVEKGAVLPMLFLGGVIAGLLGFSLFMSRRS